jgi:hypothetical protein
LFHCPRFESKKKASAEVEALHIVLHTGIVPSPRLIGKGCATTSLYLSSSCSSLLTDQNKRKILIIPNLITFKPPTGDRPWEKNISGTYPFSLPSGWLSWWSMP